jgi:hypothetical protein
MLREVEKRRGFVTTSKGGSLECVVTENGQHNPLTWREPGKTNKLLLAGNAATHSKKVKKIYVLQHKFSAYKYQKII